MKIALFIVLKALLVFSCTPTSEISKNKVIENKLKTKIPSTLESQSKEGDSASVKSDSAFAKSENTGTVQNQAAYAGKNGWLTFRGTPQRTGAADIAGPRKANLKWMFRTGGRVYADAAISDDGNTIYVASHDNSLYAIDKEGQKKWSFDTGGKIWTSPSISSEGHIYFGSDNDKLFALSSSGKKLWDFSTTEPSKKGDKPEAGRYDVDTSTLILPDGSIVFGCNTKLFALRPLAGVIRWIFEAGIGRSKIFTSAAVGFDGTIYFGTQGDFIFAINQSSKVLWSIKTKGDNDSTPVVAPDGTVYFASDDKKIRAILQSGKIKFEFDAQAPMRAPLALGKDGTLIASTFGKKPFVIAIDTANGKEKWRYGIEQGEGDFYGIQSGALIDAEGYVYFGGRDHYVYCLSPDGQLVWKYKTGDQIDSGPVLGADGTLYIGSDDKRLYAFKR